MTFNESQWLKMLFLLADTQAWIDDMCKQAMAILPATGKKQLQRQGYYLTITALAHIAEKHYHAVARHPHASKFHIPITEIVQYIKEAGNLEPQPISGQNNYYRTLQADKIIGQNTDGIPTNTITIITNSSGNIITAFPGQLTTPTQ